MTHSHRFLLIAFVAALIAPAAAQSATHMPVGFFDDASFRWADNRQANLEQAAAAGATVIHTSANWAQIAPKRPAIASDIDDPAYRLGDIDELVANARTYGLRVLVDVTGTPRWANGNKTPNHMPKRLSDLTTFTRMLATRYNGHNGHGTVSMWAVWNEPNLSLFLTPQYVGKRSSRRACTRSSIGQRTRGSRRAIRPRRSRSARPRRSAATIRRHCAGRVSRLRPERSLGWSRARRV